MSCDPHDFDNFATVLVAHAFAVQCKRHREDSALSATSFPQQADHSAPHNQPTTRKLNQRMASAEAFTPVTVHRSTQKSHGPKHGTPLKPNTAALQGTSLKPVPPLCKTVPLSPINGVSSPATGASAPPLFSPAALAGVFIPAAAFNGSRPGWVFPNSLYGLGYYNDSVHGPHEATVAPSASLDHEAPVFPSASPGQGSHPPSSQWMADHVRRCHRLWLRPWR